MRLESSSFSARVGPMMFPTCSRQTWCPPACICLLLWTPRHLPTPRSSKEKKAAFSRGLLELFRHARCRIRSYFGGSLDFGALDFGAVPVGALGVVGLGAADPVGAAGAATPDCTL